VHDPLADRAEAAHEYDITLSEWSQLPGSVDAILAAVSHSQYLNQPVASLVGSLKRGGVFVDVKSAYIPADIVSLGLRLWRL